MRALVTGASGSVGHAVCAELLSREHEVSVLVLVRRAGSEAPGIGAIKGDLSNRNALARGVEKLRPDCVLHLAAEIATQRDADKVDEVNGRPRRSRRGSPGGLRVPIPSRRSCARRAARMS